jgi:hypothetical protein
MFVKEEEVNLAVAVEGTFPTINVNEELENCEELVNRYLTNEKSGEFH